MKKILNVRVKMISIIGISLTLYLLYSIMTHESGGWNIEDADADELTFIFFLILLSITPYFVFLFSGATNKQVSFFAFLVIVVFGVLGMLLGLATLGHSVGAIILFTPIIQLIGIWVARTD